MTRKQRIMLLRIGVAAVLMAALLFIPAEGLVALGLYLIPYLVIGYDILIKAAMGLIHRRLFDENFLMAVATVGALVLAVTRTGDYTEAVAVMLFYQLGEWFQSYAVGKSRRNIRELMDIRPDYANVESDGEWVPVDPDEVTVGTLIAVYPGEKVPIDGVVEKGCSTVDTAALTGESVPRDIAEGDIILSGCINLSGLLIVRTAKEFGESTVSKILDMVENASNRKARSEQFISRFARIYTPAVCISALALALLPPLCRILLAMPADFGEWAYRALTFLVISCPCALVVSIPLSFFAAIGGASRLGILVKGSNYLEALAKTETVVFDKTGTLTCGRFTVAAVHPESIEHDRLLMLCAHAESISSHPIAVGIVQSYAAPIAANLIEEAEEVAGKGIAATVDGQRIHLGNRAFMAMQGITTPHVTVSGTAVYAAVNGRYAGYLEVCDTVKPTAGKTIDRLSDLGITDTVLLTGDALSIAEAIAQKLGIAEVYAELLPADKVARIEERLEGKRHGTLVFVGDGINDAPVLSRADIGIAMGGVGSDAAIEAADIVLMDDDPENVVRAICLAKKCHRIVMQNIVFALGVKAICLALGALGIGGLWLAVFADVGVMVLAILNAVRMLSVKRLL